MSHAIPYFDDRAKHLEELGLDPNDDDTWAIPDYDVDAIADGSLVIISDDGWLFGSRQLEHDHFAQWACRDCYEVYVSRDKLLCPFCQYIHDRKN